MADAPIMELEESMMFGMFPARLLIFEDRIEVRSFELLREKVEPRGYDRIERVTVSGEGWLANLVISEKGRRPILIRGVDRDDAERAGALIEERVTRANGGPKQPNSPATIGKEGLVRNLTELRDAGILSGEEFEAKRRRVLREGETDPSNGDR